MNNNVNENNDWIYDLLVQFEIDIDRFNEFIDTWNDIPEQYIVDMDCTKIKNIPE